MKRYSPALLLLIALLLPVTTLLAQNFPPANASSWVVDQAGILTDPQGLSEAMRSYEQGKPVGIEMELVTVSSLEGYDIESYAEKLFDAHGIGKKGANNGILILVAPSERKWRIEIGYGLEPIITDAHAYRIGQQSFDKEQMREGIYDPSLLRVIEGIKRRLALIPLQDSEQWLAEEHQEIKRRKEAYDRGVVQAGLHIIGILLVLATICLLSYFLIKALIKHTWAIENRKKETEKVNLLCQKIEELIDEQPWIKAYMETEILSAKKLAGEKHWTPSAISGHTGRLSLTYGLLKEKLRYLDDLASLKQKALQILQDASLKDYLSYPLIQDLLAKAAHVLKTDKIADAKGLLADIEKDYAHIGSLLETGKSYQKELMAIGGNFRFQTYKGHPGVKAFLSTCKSRARAASILEQGMAIDFDSIEQAYSGFMKEKLRLESEFNLREAFTAGFDLDSSRQQLEQAKMIREQLAFSDKLSLIHLRQAEALQESFLKMISSEKSIDANFYTIKKLYHLIQSHLQRSDKGCLVILEKKLAYLRAKGQISGILEQLSATLSLLKDLIANGGVEGSTGQKGRDLLAAWQAYSLPTNLSPEALISLDQKLAEILAEAKQLVRSASGQREEYLRKEQQSMASTQDASSSVIISSASVESSGQGIADSFGDGDSGGAGVSGDW